MKERKKSHFMKHRVYNNRIHASIVRSQCARNKQKTFNRKPVCSWRPKKCTRNL